MSNSLLDEPVRRPLRLPDNALFEGAAEVVSTLREAGHDAFLVGGAIRDLVLGDTPADCDIATSATPQETQKLFRRTVPVGIEFGTVMVLLNDNEYEVTTFRADGRYEDGRRPSTVSFSSHITDDLERRDLTINGLIYDPIHQEVVDYTCGLEDIDAERIRTIGEPEDRFGEDRLRMLRAVRFASRLGFVLAPETLQAIQTLAPHITEVSVERIQQELLKMLARTPAASVELLEVTGLFQQIFPQATTDRAMMLPMLCALETSPWNTATALAVSLFGASHEALEAHLGALRLSNDLQRATQVILQQQGALEAFEAQTIATQKRFLRQPHIEGILKLGEARVAVGDLSAAPVAAARQKLATWTQEQLSPPKLLDGNALIKMGMRPGPQFKSILDALEEAQLLEQLNTKEDAISWLHQTYPDAFAAQDGT